VDLVEIRFSEIISALSAALDITQGHPLGHCMRTTLIGMRIAEELRITNEEKNALFYACLLKDLGCSNNAAKMSYLFGSDDHQIKHSARLVDWTKPTQRLKHCWNNCTPDGSPVERLLKIASLMKLGDEGVRKISELRCERGAEIAHMLRLPTITAQAIYEVDELWNGQGVPRGLKKQEISLLGRICSLAQTVEVYFGAYGKQAAIDVAIDRKGRWFDPELVDVLLETKNDSGFWNQVESTDLISELRKWEPADSILIVDEECLDRIAFAFAKVVDAKSPWTYEHSTRVAEIAVGIASEFGSDEQFLRDIRRAGLLHDVGKLGVSNLILDKVGKLTDAEFAEVKRHPEFTQRILRQVPAFRNLAEVTAAHHERLDGRGYYRGLDKTSIPFVTRILTVADIYEALSAKRPYRESMSDEEIFAIFEKDSGTVVDHEVVSAFARWHSRVDFQSRVEAQLEQVEKLISELLVK